MAKQDRIAEQAHAVEQLKQMIGPDTIIHTRTEYGRGETDYVSVYIIREANEYAGQRIQNVSYYMARAAGLKVTDRGIAYGGGGYSKALEAADSTWRVVFGESIPQGPNWLEI